MSRHRFVRNIDVDAEMEDEEDSGLTAEEQAQMATSMPIARALLKDVKPPISDDAIYDSLYHYWFDVDKAVTWLRKDWEKKGAPIPSALVPTPTDQPRRKRAKRPRLEDPSTTNGTSSPDSSEVPLSALQRLSLSRREFSQTTTPTATSPAPPASTGLQIPQSGPEANGKPLSKLALLAQKRREAALAKEIGSTISSNPSLPPTTTATPNSTPSTESPAKPLSKLAQKMAAAKLAKAESTSTSTTLQSTNGAPSQGGDIRIDAIPDEQDDGLFPRVTINGHTMPPVKPSAFFEILTSPRLPLLTPLDGDNKETQLHLPYVQDQRALETRVRQAFGPDVDSPDDIVLKARSGRAGTGQIATTTTTTTTTTTPARSKA